MKRSDGFQYVPVKQVALFVSVYGVPQRVFQTVQKRTASGRGRLSHRGACWNISGTLSLSGLVSSSSTVEPLSSPTSSKSAAAFSQSVSPRRWLRPSTRRRNDRCVASISISSSVLRIRAEIRAPLAASPSNLMVCRMMAFLLNRCQTIVSFYHVQRELTRVARFNLRLFSPRFDGRNPLPSDMFQKYTGGFVGRVWRYKIAGEYELQNRLS